MAQNSVRWAIVAEVMAFVVLIGVYIWKVQPVYPAAGFVLGFWFFASVLLHRDTPETLGWRGDNFVAATRTGLPLLIILIGLTCAAGAFFGAYHRMPVHFTALNKFLKYGAFCLVQQTALNSYSMNRLLAANLSPMAASAVCGLIFAGLHWPNPVLVPLTFFGGVLMTWLFARERNIIPLTVGQALIGALVWWALPMAWHHGMRVGPGFYHFHP
jgi:Type II CAAX prenyl endopeptidase Rce1-like